MRMEEGDFCYGKIGQIICTYRKLNGISQEELAGIVGVSAGAVSKWERDISLPDLDVLCNLADYFQITVDELLGRKKRKITDIQFENEREANRYYVALELIECCKTVRNFGLLAVEEQLKGKEESIYSFLRFAVYFLLDGFYKQITPMDCKPYLVRYAEVEKDSRTANMICEVIVLIFSGENEEIVKDVISSFLGRKYAGLILKKAQLTRDEQIEKIALMDIGVEDTGVLDSLLNTDDYHIQMMLRQMENDEFLQALAGTSKEIRIRLLQNLSDRLIGVIAETLQNVQGNVDDISEAQRKMLNIINDINVKQ